VCTTTTVQDSIGICPRQARAVQAMPPATLEVPVNYVLFGKTVNHLWCTAPL